MDTKRTLSHAELISRAEAQIAAWQFELHPRAVLRIDDDEHPARARDAGSTISDWPISIYVGSNLPRVRYNDFRGGSGCVKLASDEEWQSMSPAERATARIAFAKQREEAAAKQLNSYEEKAAEAEKTLTAAGCAPPLHPYLRRKGVRPCEGLKYAKVWRSGDDGRLGSYEPALLVPLRDVAGKTWSFQAIFDDGVKRHLAGGAARGHFFEIRRRGDGGPTAYCEGLATGLSIHEATGWRVIVCVDCGNILPVMRALAEVGKLGAARIVADNDHATKNKLGEPWNPGVEHAAEAAQDLQVPYCIPMPAGVYDIASREPLTDANDAASIFGLPALASALENLVMPPPALPPAEPEPAAPAGEPAFPVPADSDAAAGVAPSAPATVEIDEEEAPQSFLPPPPEPPSCIFPPELEDALNDVAQKLCSGQYALPLGNLLAGVAAAVGGRRHAAVFRSRPQPCVLWVANIGDSGTGKSGAGIVHQGILSDRNRGAYEAYEVELKESRRARRLFKARLQKGLVVDTEDEPGDPPRPALVRLADTTLEALGNTLKAFQDRGQLPCTAIILDELRGGLESLDCYVRGGRGGRGISQLISLYDGGTWDNARIDGARCFTLPHAWVSMFGNLQPKLVPEVFNTRMFDQGGLGRWLFLRAECPPDYDPNDEELDSGTQPLFDSLMRSLLALDGSATIGLDGAARELFLSWFKAGRKRAHIEGHLDLFNKLSMQASRLALVIFLVDNALHFQGKQESIITVRTMEKALALADYFRRTQSDILLLARAGRAAADVNSIHRRAALIFLARKDAINNEFKGSVPTKTVLAWLREGGLDVGSGHLRHICPPLCIDAGKLRHERVRRFTAAAFAAMKAIAGLQD